MHMYTRRREQGRAKKSVNALEYSWNIHTSCYKKRINAKVKCNAFDFIQKFALFVS